MSGRASLPVLELEGSHLFRYLSELDPRRGNNAKGGYLKGKIILPPHIIKDNPRFTLSTCLSSSSDASCPGADHYPHSSLIHVVRKMDDNRRNRDKETVPHPQLWKQEFQVINKEVYIKNNKSAADEKRGPIPDLDKICPVKGNTRLGLQCQTPALSKVYFTRVGTIISGLKKFLVPKKSWSKKIFGPKKI